MRDKLIENALYEMALSAGDGAELSYLDSHVYRQKHYNDHKHDKIAFGNVRVKTTDSSTEYSTLDDNLEETTHTSFIKHRKSGYRNIPFDHDEQLSVNSVKGKHKNQAVNVMLHHVQHSGKPLVSSEIQSDQGHKMWKNFMSSALNNGHHVYYHEHSGFTKLNKDNYESFHRKYFGDTLKHENTNIIVSKDPI